MHRSRTGPDRPGPKTEFKQVVGLETGSDRTGPGLALLLSKTNFAQFACAIMHDRAAIQAGHGQTVPLSSSPKFFKKTHFSVH